MFLPVPIAEMPGCENPKSLVDLWAAAHLGTLAGNKWPLQVSDPSSHSSMGAPKEASRGTVLLSSDFS